MLKFIKQLFIEGFLSGAKPYFASHPELGVYIGIFNYKDEPDRQSRINSIKKMGKYGNPTSLKLAKLLGIKNPIPSFVLDADEQREVDKMIKEAFADGVKQGKTKTDVGGGSAGSMWEKLGKIATERTPKEQVSTGDLEKMADVLKNIKNLNLTNMDNMETILDMLALEDTIRLDISKSLGMSNAQLMDTVDGLTEAGMSASKLGITVHDLFETFKQMSVAIDRLTYISPETTERAALLTKTLDGFDAGKFAEAFDTVGYSLGTAMGKVDDTDNAMSEIIQTGRQFGVVMEKFLGNIGDNLKLINTYGFEKGVTGLASMVARGQALGLEMSTVTNLADKFFDPEGAIDFAAQMNVIGGAVGDLADPFKLMYMATNDLDGLHLAITDTAAAAVHFDKEKNKFSISPDQRRQLKAMAEQMGMSYQELADTAVKSARRAEVFNQIGDFSDMSKTDKELIASMSEIGKGGVAQVKIPGIDEMVDVANITEDQMGLLRKEGMTDTDVYKQQLTVAEKANQYLAAMDAGIRLMVKNELGTKVDKKIRTETLTQQIASGMPTLTDEDLDNLRKGNLDQIAGKIAAAGTAGAKNALDELQKMQANDAIITPEGITTFDKGDILVAAQAANVNLGDEQNSIGMSETLGNSITENNSTSTNNTTTMKGAKLELSGNINVNNGEGKLNGQDFLKLLKMDRGVALEASKLISDAMGQGS